MNNSGLSIKEITDFNSLGLDTTDLNEEVTKVYKVIVDITKYQDDNEFNAGNNEIYFIFNENNKIIGCQTLGDTSVSNKMPNTYSLFSYDTPITKPLCNPLNIRVYRPATNTTVLVNFKEYCKVVTSCEVGYSSWDKAALRACAMSIKNYGIVRIKRQKYAGLGFDVMDNTNDQVYNPNKNRITKCDNAVDYIWNYYLVDANSRLFPGFHVKNKNVNRYAAKNKGILSQQEAQSLAVNNNYSWKKILKYFYTRTNGTDYYNKDVAVGSVAIVE